MLQQILTGQAKGFLLLGLAIALFLYMLPAVLAFQRAQRRFYALAVLNFLLSPIQALVIHYLSPGTLVADPANLPATLWSAFIANFGIGWIVLLVWALRPGTPDPRLLRARDTKLYDAAAALPLVLWFVYGVWQLRPVLVHDLGLIAAGGGGAFAWIQLFSLIAVAIFDLLLVYMLLVRDKPVLKSRGLLPRLCGFLGTFLGVGIIQLPVAPLGLGLQILAAILVGLGSLGSFLVLWRLGKSFSIMPEARSLVTIGPYAYARHPLYSVEIVTIAGTALQFSQPGAVLIALGVLALLVVRSVYEERVLTQAYPAYAAYRARTARFIPGLI